MICLEGDFPAPGPAVLDRSAKQLSMLPPHGPVVIDGLALTSLAGRPGTLPARDRIIALIHHPLCDEYGPTDERADLFAAECSALANVRGVIVTSDATRQRMSDFARTDAKVVEPGLDRPETKQHRQKPRGTGLSLLCVGALIPRKAQDILLMALARIDDIDWSLELVGPMADGDHVRKLHRMVRAYALESRVHFRGTVGDAELAEYFANADVFVLPSLHEGFGMAFAEAMAWGLPIVACRAGAVPDTVPAQAGLLVPPGNPEALTGALRVMMMDGALRSRCRAGAFAAANRFCPWDEAGQKFIRAVDLIVAGR